MADFPYMPLFTDAYLADTRHLSTEEHGAYLLLLMAAWRTVECTLPDDDTRLARIAGVGVKKWVKLRPVMEQFFTVDDNGWTQKRLLSERNRVTISRSQKSHAGKASALKRNETDSTAVGTEQPTEREQPITITKTIDNQSINHSDLVKKIKGFHISQENAEAMIDLWRRRLTDDAIAEHLAEAAAKGLDRDGLRDHMTGLTAAPPGETRDKIDRMRADDLNAGGSRTTADSLRSLQRLAGKGLLTDETAQRLGLRVAPIPDRDGAEHVSDDDCDPGPIPEFLKRDGKRRVA